MIAAARIRALLGAVAMGLTLSAPPQAAAQSAPVQTPDAEAEMGNQAGLDQWLAGFRQRAAARGITPETLRSVQSLTFRPDVIERDRRQDEFTKAVWDYLDKAVSPDRIANGQAALTRHAALLARIEETYQVEAAYVVAIWGLESAYGAVRGDIPVLDSMASLAYEGRRGAFFEAELIEALNILQSGNARPADLVGSWAGAMGHTQFMPSSWARLAVDFDGDGRRDIWGQDPGDALASTAAYLAKSGWKKGLPWAVEVALPEGFDIELAGKRSQRPATAWKALGLRALGPELPADAWAALLLPAGAGGPAFLITDNFGAIETYNIADAYVLAVGHLADRLRGAGPIRGAWPRHERVLTLPERQELQTLLAQLGYDPGAADGKIGPLTLSAARRWQKDSGRAPDGFLTLDVLQALRQAASAPAGAPPAAP